MVIRSFHGISHINSDYDPEARICKRPTVMKEKLENTSDGVTRRSFVRTSAAALGAITVISAGETRAGAQTGRRSPKPASFLDLLRPPDGVTAYPRFEKTLPADNIPLQRTGTEWRGGAVAVETVVEQDSLRLTLTAPSTPIAVVHVRWQGQVAPDLRALGDAWERSYGDLGWRDLIPERVMPWYFATHDGEVCHGYGVRTGAAALCFWQLDPQGVSLWLNVANGGDGVELGQRQLTMATVVSRRGIEGENSLQAVASLCRNLCARASRPTIPIYGANDWNYSYGRSTAESILHDTEFIVDVSPNGGSRPFSVIDDGWSHGTAAWPDMGKLADAIKQRTARPGIWIRPLIAPRDAASSLLLPDARFGDKQSRARELAYDPTNPDAQEKIRARLLEIVAWGYEMVKHDFSTYDVLGQWGFEMGPQPTLPGWSLHDRGKTNAEILAGLYVMLRQAVGEQVLLEGCNTVGHLGQGVFDLQRTGDDTSGRQWERTRRMGVNTLAFRLPQHGTFSTLDADMVGITEAIPWAFSRQWLDVLARSGTATMVAAGPPSRGKEQVAALREAFAIAAAGGTKAIPLDWLETSTPERWQADGKAAAHYHWSGTQGASAFLGP
jgi:alpha-galactosidase